MSEITKDLTKDEKKKIGILEIQGNDYHTVARRVHLFRDDEKFKDFSIETELLAEFSNETAATIKATIKDSSGRIRATGTAMEVRGSGNVNKTSHIENCETSAIGRCLACMGLGGTEFASADEIANAMIQKAQAEGATELTEYQKAEKEFFEKVKYDEKEGQLNGTIIELGKGKEYISSKYPPEIVKKMSATIAHFEKALGEQDAA